MSAYPIINKIEPSEAPAIPETKFYSKSLIMSVVKPIFERINEMDEHILRNLDTIVTAHAKEYKRRPKFEIGTNQLILELYQQEDRLTRFGSMTPKNVVNLGKLLRENKAIIEQIKMAKKTNPEKFEGAIDALSSSGKFKPETIAVINALMSAIPSKQSE